MNELEMNEFHWLRVGLGVHSCCRLGQSRWHEDFKVKFKFSWTGVGLSRAPAELGNTPRPGPDLPKHTVTCHGNNVTPQDHLILTWNCCIKTSDCEKCGPPASESARLAATRLNFSWEFKLGTWDLGKSTGFWAAQKERNYQNSGCHWHWYQRGNDLNAILNFKFQISDSTARRQAAWETHWQAAARASLGLSQSLCHRDPQACTLAIQNARPSAGGTGSRKFTNRLWAASARAGIILNSPSCCYWSLVAWGLLLRPCVGQPWPTAAAEARGSPESEAARPGRLRSDRRAEAKGRLTQTKNYFEIFSLFGRTHSTWNSYRKPASTGSLARAESRPPVGVRDKKRITAYFTCF